MADTTTPNIGLTNQTTGGNDNTWGDKCDTNFEYIDDKFGDVTSLSITGGATVLTTTQERVNAIILTGTLVSNATIEFSGAGGTWIVKNGTDGSYTVTLKVSGQTGVVIDQGEVIPVACDGTDIIRQYQTQPAVASSVPIGAISDYAGTSAPSGWFLCYGQALSRTTYVDLFAVIGTVYGVGDGVTTFNLPDCRGRVSAGKDDMGGTSANRLTDQSGGLDGDTLGDTGGAETHTLTAAQTPSHTHTFSGTTSSNGTHGHPFRVSNQNQVSGTQQMDNGGIMLNNDNQLNKSSYTGTPTGTQGQQIGGDGAHTHTVSGTTSSSGSGNAHNNLQPTIIFNKIIKYN